MDGYYLDQAIRTMNRSVGPHMVQAVSMLDASTADQRMRVTADDVAKARAAVRPSLDPAQVDSLRAFAAGR